MLVELAPPPRIVEELEGDTVAVERIYCSHGVLVPHGDEGLVIVELAPGISARDLQELAEPTLKIVHTVEEMVVAREPSSDDRHRLSEP